MRNLSLSEARRLLPSLATDVSTTGECVVVTRNGKPIFKLVPCTSEDTGDEPLALRGLAIGIADDFDAAMEGDWAALS